MGVAYIQIQDISHLDTSRRHLILLEPPVPPSSNSTILHSPMSYASPNGQTPPFNIYQPGYSSASDVEGSSNITDYSDHETGYNSAASATTGGNPFDFISSSSSFHQPSSRIPPYVRGYTPSSSTSPPAPVYSSANVPIQSPTTVTAHHGHVGHGQTYQRIARFVGPPPVALACTECRSRHLKCDAGSPSCSRCLADKRDCNYIKSRRGWKGTRRKKTATDGAAAAKTVLSGTDTEGPAGVAVKTDTEAAVKKATKKTKGMILSFLVCILFLRT